MIGSIASFGRLLGLALLRAVYPTRGGLGGSPGSARAVCAMLAVLAGAHAVVAAGRAAIGEAPDRDERASRRSGPRADQGEIASRFNLFWLKNSIHDCRRPDDGSQGSLTSYRLILGQGAPKTTGGGEWSGFVSRFATSLGTWSSRRRGEAFLGIWETLPPVLTAWLGLGLLTLLGGALFGAQGKVRGVLAGLCVFVQTLATGAVYLLEGWLPEPGEDGSGLLQVGLFQVMYATVAGGGAIALAHGWYHRRDPPGWFERLRRMSASRRTPSAWLTYQLLAETLQRARGATTVMTLAALTAQVRMTRPPRPGGMALPDLMDRGAANLLSSLRFGGVLDSSAAPFRDAVADLSAFLASLAAIALLASLIIRHVVLAMDPLAEEARR